MVRTALLAIGESKRSLVSSSMCRRAGEAVYSCDCEELGMGLGLGLELLASAVVGTVYPNSEKTILSSEGLGRR